MTVKIPKEDFCAGCGFAFEKTMLQSTPIRYYNKDGKAYCYTCMQRKKLKKNF